MQKKISHLCGLCAAAGYCMGSVSQFLLPAKSFPSVACGLGVILLVWIVLVARDMK